MTEASALAAVIEGQAAPRREVRDGFTAVNPGLDAVSCKVNGRPRRSIPRRLADVIDEALIDSPRIVTTTAESFRQALEAVI